MNRYNPLEIEPKWQKAWDEEKIYQADLLSSKPKYLAMSMFNYPSGAGIHIGHAMNYTISDVKARFKRQQGYESYHPVGWDAFGLPAENYAIKSGVSPQQSMKTIIPSYHKQYKAMGWSNDWSKEIATHEPQYYKWTQWIFSQMYKNGLAYQDSRLQWWCEKDNTVLANEQIVDGKCWRHDGPDDPLVKQKEVKQWFFKITDYADELLDATDDLDWSEVVKTAQKNWIGKSIGAEVKFATESGTDITVFTTRPDTLYGATFLVLAPEHELVSTLTTAEHSEEMTTYVDRAKRLSEVDRQAAKDKTGVFTGSYAANPLTGEKIQIWVADYVLTGYGTGAIMAVPAHDERDYEFAKKFEIPIKQVVARYLTASKESNQVQDGQPFVERDVVQCVVRHPSDDTVLLLDVKDFGWTTLPMGGVDDGEDRVEAAKREIAEETGYTDIEFLGYAGQELWSEFYAEHKKVNRRAHFRGLEFRLRSLEQNEVNEEEAAKRTMRWASVQTALDELTEEEPRYFLASISSPDDGLYAGEGKLINSGPFDGADSAQARELIVQHLEREGKATEKVNYKMRDWSVSRQRYWGAPIPVVYCQKDGIVLVPDEDLPVVLPELDDFQPSGDGRSALARATDWLNTTCPTCGGPAERETDTLDTYICSSWYMFRYLDPRNTEQIFNSDIVNKWAPVDFYNGGDHATAHLLYARFVTRFFTKIGIMENPEPFKQMLFNGKVMASDGSAFSKSKGNGIDPLEIISSGYGADALRTYLMFAAPLEFSARWDPQGVPATHRFLSRIWNLTQEYQESPQDGILDAGVEKELTRSTHAMVKKMTEDLEANRYNTAIATAMAQTNLLYKLKVDHLMIDSTWQVALESLIACIAPFAPHIADELYHQINGNTVQKDSWPTWDESQLALDKITLAVQINGKVRAEISVESDADKTVIEDTALANERVQEFLGGKAPKRVIYVPGRLVNIVI